MASGKEGVDIENGHVVVEEGAAKEEGVHPWTLMAMLRINSPLAKVTAVFLYYLIGCLYYCNKEGWSILDTIYYATVTYTSVGYGFFHPGDEESQIFTIFYILFGCSVVISITNDFSRVFFVAAQEYWVHAYLRWRGKLESTSELAMAQLKIKFSLLLVFLMLVFGPLFFYENEPDWTVVNAVYWVVCTMTTVGFGDLTVTQPSTRVFNIFFIISCVLCYSLLLTNVLDLWVLRITNKATSDAALQNQSGTNDTHASTTFNPLQTEDQDL